MRAVALIAAFAAAATWTSASAKPPARMLVYAQEWSVYPSRPSVPAGRVTVQLWNRGQDAHDLRIRRLSRTGRMVGRAQAVRKTGSGSLSQARWRLKPGRYELYCSLPGHLRRGMHTRLTVR
jgi:uncharacterized cupredoxin-like copper-binding protein